MNELKGYWLVFYSVVLNGNSFKKMVILKNF